MSANAPMTTDELAMAQHLVAALNLEGVEAAAITPDAQLFGDRSPGLGLDSIDALEIALMVQQQYGVELRSEDQQLREAFSSLRSLTNFVLQKRRAD